MHAITLLVLLKNLLSSAQYMGGIEGLLTIHTCCGTSLKQVPDASRLPIRHSFTSADPPVAENRLIQSRIRTGHDKMSLEFLPYCLRYRGAMISRPVDGIQLPTTSPCFPITLALFPGMSVEKVPTETYGEQALGHNLSA